MVGSDGKGHLLKCKTYKQKDKEGNTHKICDCENCKNNKKCIAPTVIKKAMNDFNKLTSRKKRR